MSEEKEEGMDENVCIFCHEQVKDSDEWDAGIACGEGGMTAIIYHTDCAHEEQNNDE